MAYRRFETRHASYVLGLMNHGLERNVKSAVKNGGRSKAHGIAETLFDGVDALVVEEAGDGIHKLLAVFTEAEKQYLEEEQRKGGGDLEKMIPLLCDPRYPIIARTVKRRPLIPVYSVDVGFGDDPKDLEKRVDRVMNSHLDYAFRRWMEDCVFKVLFADGELPDAMQWFAQLGLYLEGDPIVEGRNAIIAEKVERWVAPRVAERTVKSKPTIGLLYGAAHLGIEQNLKSPRRRRRVLRKMRTHKGYDAPKFNMAQEAIFDEQSKTLTVTEFDTGVL